MMPVNLAKINGGGGKLNILQSIGVTEWLIIALIVVLLFGGKKIPELFRGLAEAMKEFKKASREPAEKDG